MLAFLCSGFCPYYTFVKLFALCPVAPSPSLVLLAINAQAQDSGCGTQNSEQGARSMELVHVNQIGFVLGLNGIMTAALLQQHQELESKQTCDQKNLEQFRRVRHPHTTPRGANPLSFRPSIEHFKKLPQNKIEKSIQCNCCPLPRKLCCPFAAASDDVHSIYL